MAADEPAWRAVYMRYGEQREDECEDLRAAVRLLYWGQEQGELSPRRIISPSGEILEDSELEQALDGYEREVDSWRSAKESSDGR